VGDGVLLPEIRAKVERMGIGGSVTFAGYLSGQSFVRHLQAMDQVWVLGSGNDWSGRAAAQARACDARVVAVDEGGLAAWADAVLESPSAEAVVRAALESKRREVSVPSVEDVAQRMIAFYAALGSRAAR
jgi:hypothetical protein